MMITLLAGCDPYSQDDYQEFVVIEAYLTANNPLPEIKVSRTLPAGERYTFEDAALDNATVRVFRLDDEGEVAEELPYNFSTAGTYESTFPHVVQPLTEYRVEVTFTDREERVTATTLVPDQISVLNEVATEIIYQGEEQLTVLLSPTQDTGEQKVYIFNTIAIDPVEANLTPFYKSAVDDNDDITVNDFINNSSGLVNEGNFTINEDGSTTLFFPWIGVAFYGENDVITSSVDRNIRQLLRSQSVQLGGSTLPPGEIPNVVYNVEGGIGVFGSFSADTVRTNFLRPE